MDRLLGPESCHSLVELCKLTPKGQEGQGESREETGTAVIVWRRVKKG